MNLPSTAHKGLKLEPLTSSSLPPRPKADFNLNRSISLNSPAPNNIGSHLGSISAEKVSVLILCFA